MLNTPGLKIWGFKWGTPDRGRVRQRRSAHNARGGGVYGEKKMRVDDNRASGEHGF